MNRTNVSGTWKNCSPVVNVAGVWRSALAFTNVGGVWKSLVGSGGGGPLSASASQTAVSGAAAKNAIATVRTQEVTVTATGGSGSYTYSWNAGTNIHPENQTSAVTRFAGQCAAGQEFNENFTCTVSDGISTVGVGPVNADIVNYGRESSGTL